MATSQWPFPQIIYGGDYNPEQWPEVVLGPGARRHYSPHSQV